MHMEFSRAALELTEREKGLCLWKFNSRNKILTLFGSSLKSRRYNANKTLENGAKIWYWKRNSLQRWRLSEKCACERDMVVNY